MTREEAAAAGVDGFGRMGFPLGVEEELLLVDARTLALDHRAPAVLEDAGTPDPVTEGGLKPDTYAAMIELVSPISPDPGTASAALSRLRSRLRDTGATLIGAGIHPDTVHGRVEHFPDERYAAIHDDVRGLLRRTPTGAVHVHVGMPDRDAALRAHNGLRRWLPLLQALAANSPFWFGEDSGLSSARAQLFRGLPRADIPRAFASWDEYAAETAELVAAGGLPDYTFLWQDLRIHPRLGTVEIRAMDAQGAAWAVEALAALVQGLAAHEAESVPSTWPARAPLMEASFQAARDGLGAQLWADGERRPVEDVLRRACDLAGDDRALRFLTDGNGADRQRAAHARGGMPALLEHLARETAEA